MINKIIKSYQTAFINYIFYYKYMFNNNLNCLPEYLNKKITICFTLVYSNKNKYFGG